MNYRITTASGRIIGRIRGEFSALMLRRFVPTRAGVGEMQAVLSGAFDLPIFPD